MGTCWRRGAKKLHTRFDHRRHFNLHFHRIARKSASLRALSPTSFPILSTTVDKFTVINACMSIMGRDETFLA